jgi:hypothetical protein
MSNPSCAKRKEEECRINPVPSIRVKMRMRSDQRKTQATGCVSFEELLVRDGGTVPLQKRFVKKL